MWWWFTELTSTHTHNATQLVCLFTSPPLHLSTSPPHHLLAAPAWCGPIYGCMFHITLIAPAAVRFASSCAERFGKI